MSGFQNILIDIIEAFGELSYGERDDALSEDTDYPYVYKQGYYDYGLDAVCDHAIGDGDGDGGKNEGINNGMDESETHSNNNNEEVGFDSINDEDFYLL